MHSYNMSKKYSLNVLMKMLTFTAIIYLLNNMPHVKTLSHQTAMPQCLYSVLKPCHRTVGSPRNMP